jgi:sugar lactone lactonase YvrE
MQPLINEGLARPQGMAVDQKRSRLLVADPDLRRIVEYPLHASDSALTAGKPSTLVDGVEARWVAVDGFGNVFFTDELRNQIMKIPFGKGKPGGSSPQIVYDGTTLLEVSSPGGIAADSYHAYWVNKQTGTQVGSLIQASSAGYPAANASAFRRAAATSLVQTLSRNVDKSYGVCLTANNVYYTQPESTVHGMKKSAERQAQTITDKLVNPRGCTWDGDGTVYVADRGADAVYAFPGNMRELSAVEVEKTVDFEDAFGVAVFSHSRASVASMASPLVWAVALFLLTRGFHSEK